MNETDQHDRTETGHEPSAVNMRAIWWSGIGLAVLIVGSFVLMWQLLVMFSRDQATSPDAGTDMAVRASQPSRLPDSPELNPDQTVALRQLRDRERAWLDEYEWLDRQAGIARIPIDRAIEIVSTSGLPTTSDFAPAVGGPTQ